MPPFLTGCFEVSSIHKDAQAANAQRIELERLAVEYDQFIDYYKKIIPQSTTIVGGNDPMIEGLVTHLEHVDSALADLKVNMAHAHSNLQILREETSRQQALKIGE